MGMVKTRAAIVKDGKVVNIVRTTATFAQQQGWRVLDDAVDEVDIGGTFDGTSFVRKDLLGIVPDKVSKRQARNQLIEDDLLDSVQVIIDSIPNPKNRKIMQSFWDDSPHYSRNHPRVMQITQALGLSEADVDTLFKNAILL